MIFIVSALAFAALLAWGLFPASSRLVARRDTVHFPVVSGNNLDREEKEFPRDFAGERNVIFVAFLQEQQALVNTWVPLAQELEATSPDVAYYELPTVADNGRLFRLWLNEVMRAGIPDPTARERTVTLYLDTEAFMRATGIPNRQEMHVLLVNRAGDILWRTTGALTAAKEAGLREALAVQGG